MKCKIFYRILMSIAFVYSFSYVTAQQTEIEHASDTGSNGPHILIKETGGGSGSAGGGWARIWLKNSIDATNRWAIAGRPYSGATDDDGILDEPTGFFYTGAQKFAVGSDGTVRINKQYTLPNMDGSAGQVLSTDGSGVASWSNVTLTDADNDTYITAEEMPDDDIIRFYTEGTKAASIKENAYGTIMLETFDPKSNVFIGEGSGRLNALGATGLQGNGNVGVGSGTLFNNRTGAFNMAIGNDALFLNTSGSNNIAIGQLSQQTNNGVYNHSMGTHSLLSATAVDYTLALGGDAAKWQDTGLNSVYVGYGAGHGATMNHAKSNNTLIGYNAGRSSNGSNNVFLGYEAGKNETGSNKLYISNSNTADPLIYGEFNNDLLKVNGTIELADEVGEIKFTEAGADRYMLQFNNASNNLALTSPAQNVLKATYSGDVTLGGDALFIDERGTTIDRLGLNTTAPTATFHMLHFNNGVDSGLKLENRTGNNWWKFYVSSSSSSLQLRNNSSGSVVGTFANTGVYTASDLRLKKNIEKMPYGLSDVMKLETKRYEYKLKSGSGQKTLGFIAQDLNKIYPELVMYEEEGEQYLVNYAGMSVVAIQAIQDQQKIIQNIQKENEVLKNENSEIKTQLQEILKRLESLEK